MEALEKKQRNRSNLARINVQIGLSAWLPQTVRQRRGGLYGRYGADGLQYKSRSQTKKHCFYLNGPQNGPRPLADCPQAADFPPSTRRWSVDELHKNSEPTRTPPKSRPRISQTAEALEPRFGGDDMRH
jgi:hypothetical protein